MKGFERTSPASARAVRAYLARPTEVMEVIEEAVESLPRWVVESNDGTRLRAERKSRIFRFRDDVTIDVSSHNGGSETVFESSSRVGKGDLGQNPRNLRALIEAVDRKLGQRIPG